MGFGYIPDYRDQSIIKDAYLRIFGYPFPSRRNEARLVFRLMQPQEGETILDIGCGEGVWCNELGRRGGSVVGIDISAHDIATARRRGKQMGLRTKLVLCDAQALPFKEGAFDKAFSICTFEHIPDDKRAFEECYRVLKARGTFTISVPTPKILPLVKVALKFPPWLKRLFASRMIQEAKCEEDFRTSWDKKFSHYRNYTTASALNGARGQGFELENKRHNLYPLSGFLHSVYSILRLFEWEKSVDTAYSFRSEMSFALVFPFFYPCYVLDSMLPWNAGYGLILHLRKPR